MNASTQAQRLAYAGTTTHGHARLLAASATRPGSFHDVLVSQDGTRVSCDCPSCAFRTGARKGRFTASRADVLAGKVSRVCWHLRHAARVAPLVSRGYVQAREAKA